MTDCIIILFTAPENGGLPNKSDSRPVWTLFGKVTANMETIMFKEKFFDWPESSRLIQVNLLLCVERLPLYRTNNESYLYF